MPLGVYVYAPTELVCELRDISYNGVGFDLELPCAPGVEVMFRLEESDYGALIVPTSIALRAEVVRVELGHTGLRLVELDGDEPRAVREFVAAKQRTILAARSGHQNPRSFHG
jgi:hypothetical protein